MSKISELRLHARNRKLPCCVKLNDLTPELLAHNLFIYEDLSIDPSNISTETTYSDRVENAVAGISLGKQVRDLSEFYKQIHTDEISLSCNYKPYNTRFAMLEPGHSISYHMDPPNIYNLICPLTHDIILEFKDKSESLFYVCLVGEIWFINPSYMHASHHEAEETRIAMLANFDYSEKVYESFTRLL